MVEQKFSLELTKNGIQQTVYAKEGEALARKLRITLTCKGEVVSLTGYSLKVFFDDETYADEDFEEFGTVLLTNDGVSASFILPETLCASPGERFCELQLVKGAEKVYSAQFRVIVEDTFGAAASAGAIAEGFQYEPLFASAGGYSGTYDGSGVIPYYDETVGATKQLSPSAITAEVEEYVSNLDTRLTEAEGDIDSLEGAVTDMSGDIGAIETALDSKADTSTVNTALAGKVDKVSGKGLSTNDYDATEKANVAANTLARHTHSNKTVLDKFGESSGTPTYDGNPIGGGGAVEDVQDVDGNSLVSDGVATIPTGKMLEIVESAEQGVVISKYSRSEIYDLYTEGKALCCQGFPISTVVRGDNYYLYFISGGYNDTPYLSRREVKSDKTITTAQLVGYFTEREYTAAKDTKLSGIATGAEVNVIDTIKDSNGNPLTVTGKSVTLPDAPVSDVQDSNGNSLVTSGVAQIPAIPSVTGKEDTANKVTSLSSSSTDTEYPSAKCVYDELQNIPSMPSGTNNGDILVWNGSAWVTAPAWRSMYQPVEYIESTGTQRIRTGVFAGPTTRLVADMQFTEQPPSNSAFLNGATNGTWGFIWGWEGSTNTNFRTIINSSYQWKDASQGDTDRHIWDLANGSQKIDNVEYSTTSMTAVSTNYDITFGSRYSNGNFNTPSKAKYYSVKIYDGNTLIRDFVPAYNVYTGEAGCYETVEQKFYGNNGTGSFILGPEI